MLRSIGEAELHDMAATRQQRESRSHTSKP
ncbi:hypothetical protein ACU4GD_21215 [Cupriavidus basilensis]